MNKKKDAQSPMKGPDGRTGLSPVVSSGFPCFMGIFAGRVQVVSRRIPQVLRCVFVESVWNPPLSVTVPPPIKVRMFRMHLLNPLGSFGDAATRQANQASCHSHSSRLFPVVHPRPTTCASHA